MRYNTLFKMQDLFMNPKLANIFPQFDKNTRNVYSFADIERRVKEYLKNVLKGATEGQDGLIVNGNKRVVLRQVRGLKTAIEALFNNIPSIAKNLRGNTKLYLPYATLGQIASLSTFEEKLKAIQAIIENLRFNPDFNTVQSIQANYQRKQNIWKRKVKYKEL